MLYLAVSLTAPKIRLRPTLTTMVDLILTGFDVYLYPETGVAISDLEFVSY